MARPGQPFQYQALAEPVPVPTPLPHWAPSFPQPVRVLVSIAALVGSIMVAPVQAYEPNRLEWHRQQPEPARIIAPRITGGASYVDLNLGSGPIESFYPDYVPRPQQFARLVESFTGSNTPLTTPPVYDPSTLEWFRPASEPVRIPPPLLQTFRTFAAFDTQPQFPTWAVGYPDAIRIRALHVSLMPSFFSDAALSPPFRPADFPWPIQSTPLYITRAIITAPAPRLVAGLEIPESYYPDFALGTRRVAHLVSGYASHVQPIVTAAYDPAGMQWFQRTSEPVRSRPPVLYTHRTVTAYDPRPQLPTWSPKYPDQIHQRSKHASLVWSFGWQREILAAAFDPQNFPWPGQSTPVWSPRPLLVSRIFFGLDETPTVSTWLAELPDLPPRGFPPRTISQSITAPVAPVVPTAFDPSTGFPWPSPADIIRLIPRAIPPSYWAPDALVTPAVFDPGTGFPWPGPAEVVRLVPRSVPPSFWAPDALIPTVFDPATGFPWPAPVDMIRIAPRAAPPAFWAPVVPVVTAVFDPATFPWPGQSIPIWRVPQARHYRMYFGLDETPTVSTWLAELPAQPPRGALPRQFAVNVQIVEPLLVFSPQRFPWPAPVDVVRAVPRAQSPNFWFNVDPIIGAAFDPALFPWPQVAPPAPQISQFARLATAYCSNITPISVLLYDPSAMGWYHVQAILTPPRNLPVALMPAIFHRLPSGIIEGITRNNAGVPLGICRVKLFVTATNTFVAETVSDVGGHYAFFVENTTTQYFLTAWKDNLPQIAGVTKDTIVAS